MALLLVDILFMSIRVSLYAARENEGRRAEVATVLSFDRIIGLLSLVLIPFLFAPFFLELPATRPLCDKSCGWTPSWDWECTPQWLLVMFSGKFRMAHLKLLGWWQGLQNNNRAHVRCDGRIRQSTRHLTRRDGPLVPCKSDARRRDGPPLTGSQLSWKLCLVAPIGRSGQQPAPNPGRNRRWRKQHSMPFSL
jgi:hypothetical protein